MSQIRVDAFPHQVSLNTLSTVSSASTTTSLKLFIYSGGICVCLSPLKTGGWATKLTQHTLVSFLCLSYYCILNRANCSVVSRRLFFFFTLSKFHIISRRDLPSSHTDNIGEASPRSPINSQLFRCLFLCPARKLVLVSGFVTVSAAS